MRTAGVAETATANTSRALPVLWTCGQGSPTKSTHTRPRARRPAAPAPTPPRGVRRPPRGPPPQEAGDARRGAPPGMGAPRGSASRLHRKPGSCGRPGPTRASTTTPPGQDTGATGTPAPHPGPVLPQAVLHCFRKQNPESGTPSRRQGGVSGHGHQAAGLGSVPRQVTNHLQQSHAPAGDARRP